MRVCGDTKWIPSFDLEPADPQCLTQYHYTSLSALNQKTLSIHNDSRSCSGVSNNTVREESNKAYSIIGIINELAANKKPVHKIIGSSLILNSLCIETNEFIENDKINYSSNLPVPSLFNESISYTTDDTNSIDSTNKSSSNTPIPPIPNKNKTSKLYQFLFGSIDSDSDDDIFPPTAICINYNENKISPKQKTNGQFVPCKMCLWEL